MSPNRITSLPLSFPPQSGIGQISARRERASAVAFFYFLRVVDEWLRFLAASSRRRETRQDRTGQDRTRQTTPVSTNLDLPTCCHPSPMLALVLLLSVG